MCPRIVRVGGPAAEKNSAHPVLLGQAPPRQIGSPAVFALNRDLHFGKTKRKQYCGGGE